MAEKLSLSPRGEADVRSGRLDAAGYAVAFADAAPRLTRTQALVAAERCLYCFDAPCVQACPTGIDVPSFIRRIGEDNLRGAARTILESNPLGGTCARVCPTEELCEEVCVKVAQEGKPVEIGRLQRYAVDAVMDRPVTALFGRAAPTGKRIAVVGAGPAGLACAFGLARLGHEVVVHDAKPRGGGLNEYGLATYKMAGDFAQAEIAWLLGIGGVTLELGWRLDSAAQLASLRERFDAVYLGVGLTRTNDLGIPGEDLAGVRDAIDFIADLRSARDPATLPIGRRVVVVGGGMTAVDAAVQSRLLGAEDVHMVYRRGPEQMSASLAEQHWAQTNGVAIHHRLSPVAIEGDADGHAAAVRFARSDGSEEVFAADMVMKAIGQKLDGDVLASAGLVLEGGRVVADADGRTGVAGLWAGGDCRAGGRDLTVEAVEDGKRAARSIHDSLSRRAGEGWGEGGARGTEDPPPSPLPQAGEGARHG
jgi:glutamate synthase (NADPH/NADH) small chain